MRVTILRYLCPTLPAVHQGSFIPPLPPTRFLLPPPGHHDGALARRGDTEDVEEPEPAMPAPSPNAPRHSLQAPRRLGFQPLNIIPLIRLCKSPPHPPNHRRELLSIQSPSPIPLHARPQAGFLTRLAPRAPRCLPHHPNLLPRRGPRDRPGHPHFPRPVVASEGHRDGRTVI